MAVITNSIEKIVRWVRCISTKDFSIDGVMYKAPRGGVKIYDTFYRDMTCPLNCGGCCSKFDILYFKECKDNLEALEKHYPEVYENLITRTMVVNGVEFSYFEDPSWEHGNVLTPNSRHYKNYKNPQWTPEGSEIVKCTHLQLDSGLCGIWGSVEDRASPIHCQMLPIHLQIHNDGGMETAMLGKKMFGRGWRMSPAAKCIMKPSSREQLTNDINNIRQLGKIADGMGVPHRASWVVAVLEKRLHEIHGK